MAKATRTDNPEFMNVRYLGLIAATSSKSPMAASDIVSIYISRTGRPMSLGSIHTTIDRLCDRNLLASLGDSYSRKYRRTRKGTLALEKALQILTRG